MSSVLPFKSVYAPIKNIYIKNFLCIKELSIENLDESKEIYFLGENGVGKTLLLQAIVLGIIKDVAKKNNFYYSLPFPKDEKGGFLHEIKVSNSLDLGNQYFAYGINRFKEGDTKTGEFGFETLFDFDRNRVLRNPIDWLEKVQLRELAQLSSLSIEMVLDFFRQIINFDDTILFDIKVEGTSFIFYEQGTPTEFEHLADGYRSVLIWLGDLLSRLVENQFYISDIKDFCGIVLVDEIDMFLHPKWEYSIVKKLRKLLPNIQWFFTTHSPVLILGASTDATIFRLYKENGCTKISKPYDEPLKMTANSLLTSILWRLGSFTTREIPSELVSSDDYVYQKIHQVISKQIQNIPELTDDKVLKMIEEEFEKIKIL